jgi:hypothetical protein
MVGWLIALAVVLLLASIPFWPVGLVAVYRDSGLEIAIRLGFLRFKLDPEGSTLKDLIVPVLKKEAEILVATIKAKKEEGGKLSDLLPLLNAIWKLLGDLRKKVRVKRLDMNLTLAGGDPCDLALNYGKAWVAVGNIISFLENFLIIKKRNVQVNSDFLGDTTRIYLKVFANMTIWRLFSLLLKYGLPLRDEYNKFLYNDEGGTENE